MRDELPVESNVRISLFDQHGRLKDVRESHNVLVNNGAAWLARLASSAAYPAGDPTPNTYDRIKYIGLGCGGALQTTPNFLATQSALVTVKALEDPVPYKKIGVDKYWLKTVDPQVLTPTYFPAATRVRFILDVLESDLSFALNTTFATKDVATEVPISEAGLYLSSAVPTTANPIGENGLIAYDVFAPITVTPNNRIRIEWELRFR